MRIHEAAKQLGLDSKEVLNMLSEIGAPAKNALASVTPENFEKLKALAAGKSAAPAVKNAPETKKEEAPKTAAPEVKKPEAPKAVPAPAPAPVTPPVPAPAEAKKEEPKPEEAPREIVEITRGITVQEFAARLEVKPVELIKKLMSLGVLATMNHTLNEEELDIVASEYNKEIKFKDVYGDDIFVDPPDDPKLMHARCPIVTIMGHVDHGKTSLLDAVRESNIAGGERGGITQKIGAYKVSTGHGDIVFIDTPGHAAFTAMRARGAQVTDIVILIVAADDGIMPQTKEAIDHAKAAGAPIIVAINKIDKDGANPDKVKQELTKYNLVAEEWGGKTQVVPISAKKRLGINELLEAILLEAEMLELKANANSLARAVVIEGRLDKGKGAVGTVLVNKGTLRVGDPFLTNLTYGKVRAIYDDHGKRLKEAPAVTPVEVVGFEDVPNAGDKFKVFESDKEVKMISVKRAADIKRIIEEKKRRKMTLEDLHKKIEQGAEKKLSVIIKGDSIGSVEALSEAIVKLSAEHDINVQIIHKDVGDINESDVLLADASDAIIIGFFVATLQAAKELAKAEGVEIKIYHIIYEVVDAIKAAMEGLLEPEYELADIGEAEVRKVFKIESENLTIAGSYMKKGKAYHDSKVIIKRNGYEILRADIKSLRRLKDTVKEVKEGYEFGVVIDAYKDAQEGDVIFFQEERQKLRKL